MPSIDHRRFSRKMGQKRALLAFVAVCLAAVMVASGDLVFDPTWPLDKSVWANMSLISAVAVDEVAGEIYVGQRNTAMDTVYVFNRDGKFLRSWGKGLTVPHGLRVQRAPTGGTWVFVGDANDNTLKKFSPDGKLAAQAGTPGVAGPGLNPLQFYVATDIAFDRAGNVFVGDGESHPNSRVVKLDPNLRVLWSSGSPGNGTDQFQDPHSLDVDVLGRVVVADRNNWRIKYLDPVHGGVLGVWQQNCQGNPWTLRAAGSQLFVADADSAVIRRLKLAGNATAPGPCATLQTLRTNAAQVNGSHGSSWDAKTGDYYVAGVWAPFTCVRFRRQP